MIGRPTEQNVGHPGPPRTTSANASSPPACNRNDAGGGALAPRATRNTTTMLRSTFSRLAPGSLHRAGNKFACCQPDAGLEGRNQGIPTVPAGGREYPGSAGRLQRLSEAAADHPRSPGQAVPCRGLCRGHAWHRGRPARGHGIQPRCLCRSLAGLQVRRAGDRYERERRVGLLYFSDGDAQRFRHHVAGPDERPFSGVGRSELGLGLPDPAGDVAESASIWRTASSSPSPASPGVTNRACWPC